MAEISRIHPSWGQAPEPLWREMLGRRLRALRIERDETLAGTAERAGISPQYLSEVERGRKEPSSEMIAALAGALDTTLAALTANVAEDLRRLSAAAPPARPSVTSVTSVTRASGASTRTVVTPAANASAVGAGHAGVLTPPVALAMAA